MPTATKTPLSSAAANIPVALIPMYTAYISPKGCIVQGGWDFTTEVPKRELVAYCPVTDPQFDEFVEHCKSKGWM